MTTTTRNRRIRRLAGGAALLFGASALGGCFELGNGEDPNCSDDAISALDSLYEAKWDRIQEIGEPDNAFEEAELDVLFAGLDSLQASYDACDVDPPLIEI